MNKEKYKTEKKIQKIYILFLKFKHKAVSSQDCLPSIVKFVAIKLRSIKISNESCSFQLS